MRDPESVDTSALPDDDVAALERYRAEAVVVLGLAAGRIDNSLYQLEILPESVKRRRRFVEQTVWNIGAALIGVALLVLIASVQRATVQEADEAYQILSRHRTRVPGSKIRSAESVRLLPAYPASRRESPRPPRPRPSPRSGPARVTVQASAARRARE